MDEIFAYMQSGDYAHALPLLQRRVCSNSNDWNAWYLLGQAYRFTGDLAQADVALNKALSLNDKEPPLYLAAGILKQLTGRFQDALSAFGRAYSLNPNYHLAYNSAAYTYEKMGLPEKAAEAYEQAIRALFGDLSKQVNASASETPDIAPFGELWIGYTREANPHFFKVTYQDGESSLQVDSNYFSYLPRMLSILVNNQSYPIYLRNRAKVLKDLGRLAEAMSCEKEAACFG